MVRLGLDQLEQEEQIQRYQFRRLISSAGKVFLVYKEDNRNERSRFIEELLWEREKTMKKIDVLAVAQAQFCVDMHPRVVAIKKKKEEIAYLRNLAFSPSSVNTYLKCPLQFYYKYVLGLEEKDDLLDEPEARDVGTFIHGLLEITFKRFLNKKPLIDKKFQEYFFEEMDRQFSEKLEKRMKSDSFLLKEILDVRMRSFLRNEPGRAVVQVLGLEQKFTGKIVFGRTEFCFQARVDRIDRLSDNTVLVIDYKTGDVKNSIPKKTIDFGSAQFDRVWIRDNIRSFQLPIYLYFLNERFENVRTNACLYNIRDVDSKDNGLAFLLRGEADFSNKDRLMQEYLNSLGFILNEILDPDIDFVPDNSDEHTCSYCPFGALCR
jgi:ATP-dependent helicase/DNAse subunit B